VNLRDRNATLAKAHEPPFLQNPKQSAATLVWHGGWCEVQLLTGQNRTDVPAIFADIERSGFQRRSILLATVDTIVGRGLTVTEYNWLPPSTITTRSSITGAPGAGWNCVAAVQSGFT